MSINSVNKSLEDEKNEVDLTKVLWEKLDSMTESVFGSTSSGKFFASAVGDQCDRNLWLHYNGKSPSKPIDSKLRRVFDHGNITQERYKKYFTKLGVFVQDEVTLRISDPVHLSGRLDYLLSIDGKPYIVELKTIKKDEFIQLDNAKPEHAVQLQLYLNMQSVPTGSVLYECKDNQEIKLFRINRNKEIYDGIIARCLRIANMMKMPTLASVAAIHNSYCDCQLVKDV